MDFTPEFEGDAFKVTAYALFPTSDAAFPGMDTDACHWMTCPVVKGVKQTYTFRLSMGHLNPKGAFHVRWLMTRGDEKKCCFVNRFKLE